MKKCVFIALSLLGALPVNAQNARISVDASQVINRVSPLLYGSCIEDVNHEIYGGLYDQKIFGESFEEPQRPGELAGWSTFGGNWRMENNPQAISVEANGGAKIVRGASDINDGQAEVQLRFPDRNGDNAGLLLRVNNAGVGADNFDGYEVSLSAARQTVLLGKHLHNWQLLREVPVSIQTGQWQTLRVQMQGPRLQIFVNNSVAPAIDYTDTQPIISGKVALRTWNSDVTFGNLRINNNLENPFSRTATPAVSGMWDRLNDSGEYLHDSINPYNGARSQMIFRGDEKVPTTGIFNRGLNRWGIAIQQGQPLAGRLYLRGHDLRGPITLALQSADGSRTYAWQKLKNIGPNWAQYAIDLKPNATDNNARFAVWLDEPGSLWIDQVTLGGTGAAQFKSLPIRADIGSKLQQQGLTFMRYGGTMVNAPEYRWKKMIGDPDKRPPYRGHWYPHSTNGFGIEDFVQFCEAAGFEAAFAINVEETAQDAGDLVEYLNGPVASTWGRRRAQNGHPKPYNVRYIELGNEEVIWGDNAADYDHYIERCLLLIEAMHAKDPNLQFVHAAWWRPNSPSMEKVFKALNGKVAYWDLHVGGDNLNTGQETDQNLTQMQTLFQKWVPGSTMKVAIFEENGGLHNQQRALGHALNLNAVRRHGDFVLTSCPANALQPLGQNDNGWDQGQIFFTPSQVWGMPPFYAQQMASRNHLPLLVKSETTGGLDVTATRSEDGKTLVLHVVNAGDTPITSPLQLQGFKTVNTAQVEQLAAPLNSVNTPEKPEQVKTERNVWNVAPTYTFAPHSYTILRFE